MAIEGVLNEGFVTTTADKLINWTRTAALNDADTIYGEIAQARRCANA